MTAWTRQARVWAIAAAVATTGWGCSEGSGRIPLATVTDSAGVRVVTYDLTGVTVPTYVLLAEYDLQIGLQDGAPEYTFSSVPDLDVAPNGSLVVSDELAKELRVYDSRGLFLGKIGQSGEGPGEFANAPTVVGFSADTVFAFDSRNSRLTSFLIGGDLLTMTSLRSDTYGRPVFTIRQDDGTYLAQSPWVNREPDRTVHGMRLELDSIVIERLDATGALIDTVFVMADRTRVRVSQAAAGESIRTLAGSPPFVARAFLRSDGRRGIVGRSDFFELQLLGPEGEAQTAVRVLGVQNPMTGDEIRRRQEAAIREAYGPDGNAMATRLNVEFIPDGLQAFQTIVVSEDGDIWVALTEFDGSGGYDWLVFDGNGGLRGSVRTPPDLIVFEVHQDFVLGVYQDELDVPYVRRYPLQPSSASHASG